MIDQNEVLIRANNWVNAVDIEDSDKIAIRDLISSWPQSSEELTELFYQDLEFGTGGLRSPVGMGINRINKYTVRKATQALCNAIPKKGELKAVVSYDSRHYSIEFSKEVSQVFAANGFKVYLFDELTPTPLLSFAIRKLNASTGVMVTASHNPPKYNGYKAFWSDGAQVVPPYDKAIIDEYNKITSFAEAKTISFDSALSDKKIEYVGKEIYQDFYQSIKADVLINKELCETQGHKLKVIYTAIHGTGKKACFEISQMTGFTNFISLKAQEMPDPNFSTVKFPNPEDPEAMALAVEEMLKTNADLAYGTDPDCDRLGVVANHKGKPIYLNGNQLGALYLNYVLKNKELPSKAYVLKSIVTSDLQTAIAKSCNVKMENTLTGFKWMASAIKDHEIANDGMTPVFASEESFGYMPNFHCRDKDGVSSIALMNEIALNYKVQEKTLIDALNEIYEEYGYYQESLLSFTFEGISGKQKIGRIMEFFRSLSIDYFKNFEISSIYDYLTQQRRKLKDNSVDEIKMTKSNVLAFEFTTGDKLFLRPSGTEPKIKFYSLIKVFEGNLEQKKTKAEQKIKLLEQLITETCEKI